MKQPHTIDKDDTPARSDKVAESRPVKFQPKLESKDDHVAHIAELARELQKTQPGSESFGRRILQHVAAIQNPEAHDRDVAAEQKAAFEADALSAKQRRHALDD